MKWLCLIFVLFSSGNRAYSHEVAALPDARNIKTLLAQLKSGNMDTAILTQAQASANSSPPADLTGKPLVDFLLARADALRLLGNTDKQLADLRLALSLAQPRERYRKERSVSYGRIKFRLMQLEFNAGDPTNATRIAEQLLLPGNSPGERLLATATMVQYFRDSGNRDGVVRLLDQANTIFRDAPRSKSWHLWRLNWTGHYESTRAWAYFALGKLEEAEAASRRAVNAARGFAPTAPSLREKGESTESPDWYDTTAIEALEIDLAFFLLSQNKMAEAEFYARDVLSRRIANSRLITASLRIPIQRLGDVMLNSGRFAEATELYRSAIEVVDVSKYSPTSTRALVSRRSLASSLAAQEKWSDAMIEFTALRKLVGASGMPQGSYRSTVESYALLKTGDTDSSIRSLSGWVDWYRKSDQVNHPAAVVASGFLAEALAVAGRQEDAAAAYRDVIPKLVGDSGVFTDARLTPLQMRQRKWIVDAYLEYLGKSPSDEASVSAPDPRIWLGLIAVDGINGQQVQRAIQDSAVRAVSGVTRLSVLARKHQDLQNEIDALYLFLGRSAGNDPTAAGGINAQFRSRLTTAIAELRETNTHIDREFPAYRDLLRPKSPTLGGVQAMLREDEVVLVTYPASTATYVWAIPKQGPPAFHIAAISRANIESKVSNLRRALDPNAFGIHATIPEFDLQTAYELHNALVRPLEATINEAKHLTVIAHGALAQVPFALLTTAATEVRPDMNVAFAEYKSVPWLVRKFAISQIPSLSSLITLRAQPAGNPNRENFAGFGDPIFNSTQQPEPAGRATTLRGAAFTIRNFSRGLALDSSQLSQLPRLPDTADEIRGIASALKANFDRDVFLGVLANEREVKTRFLANRKVIAFATHGLIPGELNGLTQPALALTAPHVAGIDGDGLLTLEEVLGLKLDADWVVLSACNTAAGEGAGAEAITGLGRAFFYAGTRALLVSNWPVETVSARLLTTGIFERQAANAALSRDGALRETMLDLIDNGTAAGGDGRAPYSYSHPLFWAPFTLVGDGR